MKTILVPTDFSENANSALHYAANLANLTKAKIILFHTEALQVAISENPVIMDPAPAQIKSNEQKLEELAQKLTADFNLNQPAETICLTGNLSLRLNEMVRTREVDLVVIGTKGATKFLDKILGTNAAAFIKVALCPVLVIPPNARYEPVTRLAYAADFESDERVPLHQLLNIAEPLKAEVYVINIKSDQQLDTILDDEVIYFIQEEFPDYNLHINQIKEDDVVKGLQEFIEQNGMHILAVSIHEHSFLEEFFHRSITRQLAMQTHVPLLTLPCRPYVGRPEIKHKMHW
jgi:nucleotide-binding universal stress UspA family protein